jgi:hypothetical protein
MKKTLKWLLIGFAALSIAAPAIVEARGHYSGGTGSSHNGGSYKNSRTGNHYTKHR